MTTPLKLDFFIIYRSKLLAKYFVVHNIFSVYRYSNFTIISSSVPIFLSFVNTANTKSVFFYVTKIVCTL